MTATVLVIEDEPDVLGLIRMNLELDGFHVVAAATGSEGLAAALACQPDVILLDVMLPDIDGWEVLSQLKRESDSALACVPVLMLTARTATMDRLRGGIEGAVRYLIKPLSPGELRAEVSDAISGPPEPVRRRQAQQDALVALARLEGGSSSSVDSTEPHPHLTRLEPSPARPAAVGATAFHPAQLEALSSKQRQLLAAVSETPTVSEAAARLAVSRSNVYAGLRRIAGKLGIRSVTELVHTARAGGVG